MCCRTDLIEIQSELFDEVDFAGDLEGGSLARVQHSHHLLSLALPIPQHLLHSTSHLHTLAMTSALHTSCQCITASYQCSLQLHQHEVSSTVSAATCISAALSQQ